METIDLTSENVESLLAELARELDHLGVDVHVQIVGGAAMILRGYTTRATQDVDAIPPFKSESWDHWTDVSSAVAAVGRRHGMSETWLNGNAGMFLPSYPQWEQFKQIGCLRVQIASAETLLAMKLAAGRRRDEGDIWTLMGILQIRDKPTKAVDIAYQQYGEDSVVLNDGRQSYLWFVTALAKKMTGQPPNSVDASTPLRTPEPSTATTETDSPC